MPRPGGVALPLVSTSGWAMVGVNGVMSVEVRAVNERAVGHLASDPGGREDGWVTSTVARGSMGRYSVVWV